MVFFLLTYKKIVRDFFYSSCAIVLGLALLCFYFEARSQLIDYKVPKVNFSKRDPLALAFLYPEKETKLVVEPVDFSKKLVLFFSPQKPGSKGQECLYIGGIREEKREKVFLDSWFNLKTTSSGYCLSQEKTPLAFRVIKKGKRFYIEQDIECKNLSGSCLPEFTKGFFPVTKPYEEKTIPAPFVELFKSSYIGKDLLRVGDNFHLLVNDESIFMKKGDLFAFIDQRWTKSEIVEKNDQPLFRIKEVNSAQLILEGWDLNGKYYTRALRVKKIRPPQKKPANWISQIRKRTKNKVSANVNGKRMFLKKGDWLVEKNKKWSALRTDLQKEKFLMLKGESDVFVFENIDEKKGDKKLVGFLYNASRTQKQLMTISFKNKQSTIVSTPVPEKKTSSSENKMPPSESRMHPSEKKPYSIKKRSRFIPTKRRGED